MIAAPKPVFWRDFRMPHVELRRVEDGRGVMVISGVWKQVEEVAYPVG